MKKWFAEEQIIAFLRKTMRACRPPAATGVVTIVDVETASGAKTCVMGRDKDPHRPDVRPASLELRKSVEPVWKLTLVTSAARIPSAEVRFWPIEWGGGRDARQMRAERNRPAIPPLIPCKE